MRTLQRLQHVRRTPPPPTDAASPKRVGQVARQRVRTWWLRARFFTAFVALPIIVCYTIYWFLDSRLVGDGLVHANLVTVPAPAPIRVVEVLCLPGEFCERGTPLMRLEALRGNGERRALELIVEQRRLRLSFVETGGELDVTDLARRSDLVAQAERELDEADAGHRVASAELDRLLRSRDARAVQLELRRHTAAGRVGPLEERLQESEAQIDKAEALALLATYDDERTGILADDGLATERGKQSAYSERKAARSDVESVSASARAVKRELESARKLSTLEERNLVASLAEVDAEIETARRQIEAATLRHNSWQDVLRRRRALFPAAASDQNRDDQLREIELSLLHAELDEAVARLDAYDAETGNTVLLAEADGVIDQLFVRPGAAIDEGQALLTYYDPNNQWLVVYAEPERAHEFRLGQSCRLISFGDDWEADATVSAIGYSFVPCPERISQKRLGRTDVRLPIEVTCERSLVPTLLRPGMLVKVVFDRIADNG